MFKLRKPLGLIRRKSQKYFFKIAFTPNNLFLHIKINNILYYLVPFGLSGKNMQLYGIFSFMAFFFLGCKERLALKIINIEMFGFFKRRIFKFRYSLLAFIHSSGILPGSFYFLEVSGGSFNGCRLQRKRRKTRHRKKRKFKYRFKFKRINKSRYRKLGLKKLLR